MTSNSPTPARDWRSQAACRNTNPETFFPTAESGPAYERQVNEAKAMCAGCSVRAECLDEALIRIPDGIAGGLTPAERRRLTRGRAAARRVSGAELARLARSRAEVAAAGAVLLASGRTRQAVAQACGVSERTVYRWRAAAMSSTSRAAL
jgi:hypothetical protein